jgi:hypothetical protein
VNRVLKSSRRQFAKHFSFALVAFDIISRRQAFSRLYYRLQTSPAIALKSVSITPEQLKSVLRYNDSLITVCPTYTEPPPLPNDIANVSALKRGIAIAEGSMWGPEKNTKKPKDKLKP